MLCQWKKRKKKSRRGAAKEQKASQDGCLCSSIHALAKEMRSSSQGRSWNPGNLVSRKPREARTSEEHGDISHFECFWGTRYFESRDGIYEFENMEVICEFDNMEVISLQEQFQWLDLGKYSWCFPPVLALWVPSGASWFWSGLKGLWICSKSCHPQIRLSQFLHHELMLFAKILKAYRSWCNCVCWRINEPTSVPLTSFLCFYIQCFLTSPSCLKQSCTVLRHGNDAQELP